MAKKRKLQAAKEALEREGYEVKRKYSYVRHAFHLDEPTLDDFLTLAQRKDLTVAEAVTEALAQWVEANKRNGKKT